jgi:hypothetical protein
MPQEASFSAVESHAARVVDRKNEAMEHQVEPTTAWFSACYRQ